MPTFNPAGDLFNAGANILVNPVNCVGKMGKGLALAFKQQFPSIMQSYEIACSTRSLKPGQVLLSKPTEAPWLTIANMATKDHWRDASNLEWVVAGMRALSASLPANSIIAMPQVGCGNGGLNWGTVLPTIMPSIFEMENNGHNVIVFGPDVRPKPKTAIHKVPQFGSYRFPGSK